MINVIYVIEKVRADDFELNFERVRVLDGESVIKDTKLIKAPAREPATTIKEPILRLTKTEIKNLKLSVKGHWKKSPFVGIENEVISQYIIEDVNETTSFVCGIKTVLNMVLNEYPQNMTKMVMKLRLN
jgi:hypothetical protein